MPLYEHVAGLPVEIESVELERLEYRISEEFTRATTVFHLRGAGEEGIGEDVTYDSAAHDSIPLPQLERTWQSLDELSQSLEGVDLFAEPPAFGGVPEYRRWAIESAALDLALRQAGLSLAEAVRREPRPVTFVASMGLGNPPTITPVQRWLDLYPDLRFKLDPTSAWDEALVGELAGLACVDTVDLKGAYRNTPVDQGADPRLYRLVAERFPEAWIEDPNLDDDAEAAAALRPHRDRITWDAPIHSVADAEALPFPPRTLNVKPSRFGSVRRLFDFYDWCAARGIGLYGGGQWELGPGRGQIQLLAALFHSDGPNDVAPGGYNRAPEPGLPVSPLDPAPAPRGFRREDGTHA
jgi:L-alanine-DL-glutamate epimerase-like enolase superfamily enzyme